MEKSFVLFAGLTGESICTNPLTNTKTRFLSTFSKLHAILFPSFTLSLPGSLNAQPCFTEAFYFSDFYGWKFEIASSWCRFCCDRANPVFVLWLDEAIVSLFISSIISLISSHLVPPYANLASSRHSPSPSALGFLALYRSSSGSFCSPSLPSAHLRLLSLQSAFLRVCVLAVWVPSCQNKLHVCMCACVNVSTCVCDFL